MENICLCVFLGFSHVCSNCIGNEITSRRGSSTGEKKEKKEEMDRMLPEALSCQGVQATQHAATFPKNKRDPFNCISCMHF